ncbi:hypothetical protein GCM10009771_23780 [Nesterenkonia flava]
MTSTSSTMEMVQFQPESASMPRKVSTLWNSVRMNDTAQLKGHIIASRKAICLSESQARRMEVLGAGTANARKSAFSLLDEPGG